MVKVTELYKTIQGEGSRSGLPCVMIRLAECNASCTWCDTPAARGAQNSVNMTTKAILDQVMKYECPLVEITGGEPMLQDGTPPLLTAMCEAGFETLLETNGLCDLSGVDPRTVKIVDIKCPSTGEQERTIWENFSLLSTHDEVKCVIADRNDYRYACNAINRFDITSKCKVFFTPVHGLLDTAELATWILDDRINVHLGIQLHKIIWPGGEPHDKGL